MVHIYLSTDWIVESRVKPQYIQYPGHLPKHTYTRNFGAQLSTVYNKANNSSYVGVCNYFVLLLRNWAVCLHVRINVKLISSIC
jgi:lipoprotein signal peptidase